MNKNDEDELFKRQLLRDQSFPITKYVDIDRIRLRLPSFKYLVNEIEQLEQSCTTAVFKHVLSKPNLHESVNAKNLCRAGVPPRYMRCLLLKMSNISVPVDAMKFKDMHELTFKKHKVCDLGDFVPYYTGAASIEESLPVHFLNEEGIIALKEILWMLNSVIATIEHSPLLIKLTSMILMFCSQEETYEIMREILETNYNLKETFGIRWHMRFVYADNEKIITSMCESIREISSKSGKDSFAHFQSINFPAEKLYEDICFGFFMEYFNFVGMLRLLPFFLLEGVKSTYRLSYSIIKTLRDTLLSIKSPDQIISILREKSSAITDISKLFNQSYTFKLTRHNNKYEFQKMPDNDKFAGKRNSYYLPHISSIHLNDDTGIMTGRELGQLWSQLPFDLKIRDAKKVYCTAKDGCSFITLYGLTQKYPKDSIVLFLVSTDEDEVFGCLLSNLMELTSNKFTRPMTALLVQVRPEVKIYEVEGDSDQMLYCDSQCIMFGNGPNGPAFRIENDLDRGYSYAGSCFKSPVLVKNEEGKFKVSKAEIFILN